MLTEKYTKKMDLIDHTASVFSDTAEKLVQEQGMILETYYNKRTGSLTSHLSSGPFNIQKSESGVRLVIDYLSQIRFMDLEKTGRGKKKKVYHPIYNKPVYGYLFGYAYSRLRYGLTSYLRQETTAKVKAIQIEIPV